MNEETDLVIYEGVAVPESVLLRRGWDRCGSIPDLDDDELADPGELERQALREEFEPLLRLPRPRRASIDDAVDPSGGICCGPYGEVLFRGSGNRRSSKGDELRDELKNVLIMLSIVRERIPGRAKFDPGQPGARAGGRHVAE